jgi:hypothetical protein
MKDHSYMERLTNPINDVPTPQALPLAQDIGCGTISVTELLAEAIDGHDTGRRRRPRRVQIYTVAVRDLANGDVNMRGPVVAKNEAIALLKAFGRKTTKARGRDPAAELQRLLFEIGALTAKPANHQYQLISVERLDNTNDELPPDKVLSDLDANRMSVEVQS